LLPLSPLSYYFATKHFAADIKFPSVVELTTQLLILENILWLPLCQINKFGLNTLPLKAIAIPYTCGLSDIFVALPFRSYWCKAHEETPCWWAFWITWCLRSCLMGKMTKTPFFGTMKRAIDLLEIIHTDVCGPMNIEARDRYHYFMIFTRWFEQIWVYLLDET
jgi:hypothetical protein